jgi:enamine deaminase RidA (YjgF/YER057c/UK114 family)
MILPHRPRRYFAISRLPCRRAGGGAANLVKLTVFLTDMGHLGPYREARNRFFASVAPPAAPAVTLVEVSKLYGPDFMIEIEAIAAA